MTAGSGTLIRVYAVAGDPAIAERLEAGLRAEGFVVVGHGTMPPPAVVSNGVDVWVVRLDAIPETGLPSPLAKRPLVAVTDDATVTSWLQKAGLAAWGAVGTSADPSVLGTAVRAVALGMVVLDQGFARLVSRPLADRAAPLDVDGGSPEALTPRERNVLDLLAEGRSNRSIASTLGLSEHTVKFHLASIFGKLGASSRTEAVRLAIARGLITI